MSACDVEEGGLDFASLPVGEEDGGGTGQGHATYFYSFYNFFIRG